MKQSLLIAALIIVSDIIFGATPPEPVLKAFNQKFSDAKEVKWGKENDSEWEASFKFDNIITSAIFQLTEDGLKLKKKYLSLNCLKQLSQPLTNLIRTVK